MALEVDSSFQFNILVISQKPKAFFFLKYSSQDDYLPKHIGDCLMWRLLQEDTQFSKVQLWP